MRANCNCYALFLEGSYFCFNGANLSSLLHNAETFIFHLNPLEYYLCYIILHFSFVNIKKVAVSGICDDKLAPRVLLLILVLQGEGSIVASVPSATMSTYLFFM